MASKTSKPRQKQPLRVRRNFVQMLRQGGRSIRLIAWFTGEHVSQVQRWTQKMGGNVVGKNAGSRMDSSFQRLDFGENVVGGKKFSKFFPGDFLCFDEEGRPDIAGHRHPVEEMEPEEIAENRHMQIMQAALRYILRMEERPMAEVAQELGCTRAAISRALGILADKFGVRARNQKSEQARRSYRRARMNAISTKK